MRVDDLIELLRHELPHAVVYVETEDDPEPLENVAHGYVNTEPAVFLKVEWL